MAAGAAHSSRRAFLQGAAGVGVGSAVLLSGCGAGAAARKGPRVAASEPRDVREADISLMNGMLDLEYTAVAAYEAGVPLLAGRARAAAELFLAHELAHAAKLEATIRAAGGKPNPPPASYHLGRPGGEAVVLDMLREAEAALVNGYLAAIPHLLPGWLKSVAAGILANEAEHVSVLRALQGRPPVPSAFVTASE